MIGYVLPTGEGRKILWYPAPRLPWGELKGLGRDVTILTPDTDIDVDKLSMLTKDNVHRPTVQRGLGPHWRFYWISRLMLWGIIWLAGIDDPLEDLIGGLYLLFGLPLFVTLTRLIYQGYLSTVVARFEAVAYAPECTLIYSPRLKALADCIDAEGITKALDSLDRFGLRHLQEFYRRAAWAPRWTTPAPTGQGVL